MSLTRYPGPLGADKREETNYRIEGPAHRLFMHDFGRRLRATFAGETVFDTTKARLLHETGLLPQSYIPFDDINKELLTPTDHHTYCPFKGTASYWSVTVGDRTAENAVWSYPEPNPEAAWLDGYAGFYWDAMDEWYDEDERVNSHLRDPFHRVDVRASSRHVTVKAGEVVIAETTRPRLLSETALPNRFYIPREDVHFEHLTPTETQTVCPYKGTASYWSVTANGKTLTDAAWSYPKADGDAQDVSGYLSFLHEDITVEE